MRAVLFEGTPEEFARVEAIFRAGGDPTMQTRSLVLQLGRPKAWPELSQEHCYELAKRVLERAPASLVEALDVLSETQRLTIEAWASEANRHPDELGGTLAELSRCASRAFMELFGCDHAPERVKGAAYLLLEKIPSDEGACFAVRPGLARALADMGLLDAQSSVLEESEEAPAPEPTSTVAVPRPLAPAAKAPPDAARPVPVRQAGGRQVRGRAAVRIASGHIGRRGQDPLPFGGQRQASGTGTTGSRQSGETVAGVGDEARPQPVLTVALG